MLLFLRENDQQAFAAIYDRYRQDIFAYALTLLKLPEVAEDLVQDVFVKVWDARSRIDIQKNFRSYLFRVCHNGAIDIHKKIAKDRNLAELLVNLYRTETDPDQQAASDMPDYHHLLEEALGSLTPQRRRIYEMCKKEKKTYDEVARELNISPNTVKNHMVQTVSILRDYLNRKGRLTTILFLLLQKIL